MKVPGASCRPSSEALCAKAARHLAKLGVEIRTGVVVERVDATGVWVAGQRIESDTVLWTAGVQASPLIRQLGVKSDRAGRAIVGNLLNIPGHPDVFVIGDAAAVIRNEKRPLPGVAQVAIQEGRFVGRVLAARLAGRQFEEAFRYRDRGNMAVVGKNFAILERGNLRDELDFDLDPVGPHPRDVPSLRAKPSAGSDAVVMELCDGATQFAADPRASTLDAEF